MKNDGDQRVPVFYKASGTLPKNTLDFPLFDHAYRAVVDEFGGPSFEPFSFVTARGDVSNMFEPGKTRPGAKPTRTGKRTVFHNPIMSREGRRSNPEGFVDLRDAIPKKSQFSVSLVDPPFTSGQQRELYSAETNDTFLNKNDRGISEMYKSVMEFCAERTRDCIMLWGYKMVQQVGRFRLAALVVGSGGSGHPDIFCAVYVPGEAQRMRAVAALERGLEALKNVQTFHDVPVRWSARLRAGEAEALEKIECTQADLTRFRENEDASVEKNHPKYLSRRWTDMFMDGKRRKFLVHDCRMRPFASATVGGKKRKLFAPENSSVKHAVLGPESWNENISLLLEIERRWRR